MNRLLCKNCGHQLSEQVAIQSGGSVMEKPDTIGDVAREIYQKLQKGETYVRHSSGGSMCLHKGKCVCAKPEKRN